MSSTTASGGASGPVRVEIAALSHRGRVRETNEDSFAVFRLGRFFDLVTSSLAAGELASHSEETGHIMIVADGVGGHQGGDVASRTVMIQSLEFILRSPKWVLKLDDPATRAAEIEELHARVREALSSIHSAVRRRAAGDPNLAGMGTTLTSAYSVNRDLFITHVGDSKAFLVRDGVIRKLTRDHTVAQEFADLGVIQADEIASHAMQHVLTRAMGGPGDPHGDIQHVQLLDGDRLLLCSDGLTDMVSEEEIRSLLGAHPSSQQACQALVDLALEHGGLDNVTVIAAAYHAT